MALTVRRTGKADYSRYIKALIVGSPGAGKTLTSSTWKNPLIASAEGGLMSIADRGTPYVDVRDSETLFQLKIMLDQEPETRQQYLGFPVDTLVIDTIDEVQKILIRERLEEGHKESMELRDWGWLGEQMRAMIRGFRNLDLNVVMTCHVKESSDSESGRLYYAPAMAGAIGDELPAFVDLALLLKAAPKAVIVDGEAKRVMSRHFQTYPDPQHPWIKDRSGKLPEEFDVNFTDDYQRMYDAIYGDLTLPDTEVVVTATDSGPSNEISSSEVTSVTAPEVVPPAPSVKTPNLEMRTQTVETPAPKPKAQAKKPPVEEVKNDVPACAACGIAVDNEDQADISRIRFRKVLCRDCFLAAKK